MKAARSAPAGARCSTLGRMARHAARLPALLAAASSLAAIIFPMAALGWTQSASFETHIHGHTFARVSVENRGCELRVTLPFDAPAPAYQHEAASRNIYRFHARIKLDKGHELETPVFQNSVPGARQYGYTKDTSSEGCWAKDEHQLRAVDIEGCRGAGCKPDPFK
jgi:hypothetical protein